MVMDKQSGQIVSVEELVKRTIARCSVGPQSSNGLSRAASDTSIGRVALVQSGPGFADAEPTSKKRKAEEGQDRETSRGEKRACVREEAV